MAVSRLTLVLVVASSALLGMTRPITASSGGLKVLVAGNCAQPDLVTAIRAQPSIGSVTAFDTSAGTPTAAQFTSNDLVVDTGDDCNGGYKNAHSYGNRLAEYVDHGGAVLQTAYDVWDSPGTYPTGRFESQLYSPFFPGPRDDKATTLGTVLTRLQDRYPGLLPIVQGLGTFATSKNTTDSLAANCILLAPWADGRVAIALRGRVVATSAGADDEAAIPGIARLARNMAVFYNAPPDTHLDSVTINSGRRLASFRFLVAGFGPGSGGYATGFRCELKEAGVKATFTACSSPKRYTRLAPGKYVFEVAAVSRHGSDPTPATKRFRIFP